MIRDDNSTNTIILFDTKADKDITRTLFLPRTPLHPPPKKGTTILINDLSLSAIFLKKGHEILAFIIVFKIIQQHLDVSR